MRLWLLLIGVLLPISFSFADPRQCEKEMKEVLAFDGTLLGPITDTKTLKQMNTALADADTAYKAALKTAPPQYDRYSDRKQTRIPENLGFKDFGYDDRRYKQYIEALQGEKKAMNEAHSQAMAPTSKILNEARAPFDDASNSYMSMWNSTTGSNAFYFDKIEQHGTDIKHLNRVYSKENRITGLVMHQFDSRLNIRFNEDCSIHAIIETNHSSIGGRGTEWIITPQLCKDKSWDNSRNAVSIEDLGGGISHYSANGYPPEKIKDLRRICDSFAKLFETNQKGKVIRAVTDK